MTTSHTLQRSPEDRLIFGVSGGLAERLGVDPVAVRIGWLVACLFTAGGAAILYVGMGMLIPMGPSDRTEVVRPDPKRKRLSPVELREESRILLEVRKELGPEYEDEMIDSFLEKIETRLQPPPAPRLGHRLRRFGHKVFWLGILTTGLALFAVAFQNIFGDTLLIMSVMILAIPVIGYGIFKLSKGMPD